jgi:uncharacterized damage-inducible protein DinB
MAMTIDERKYPIGKYSKPVRPSIEERENMILILEQWPAKLRTVIEKIPVVLLEQSYREGGWTVRQIVHHLADSHMNMYIRVKLALTGENVTINPYDENAWAAIPEAKQGDPFISIVLLESLHTRLVDTFRSMSDADFDKTYFHPGNKKDVALWEVLPLYVWHSHHHLGHIGVVTDGNGVKP